ncbi:acetyltransferas-like protein [Phaeosphaeriaceae sp. SRC1lsM3a]|nr:acetyltransferas-like protein [Stagonospora sp. SRC1lsM3a]
MVREYSISEATSADAEAIASLFGLSWTSPLSRLMFGDGGSHALTTAIAPQIARQMMKPNVLYLVARHAATNDVVAVAQWTLPAEDWGATSESQQDQGERQELEDEIYAKSLPPGSNTELVMDFTVGLRTLKLQLLHGQKHYSLDNLATHPEHRGQRLASRLIEWILQRADKEKTPVYLETGTDNAARRMYERLGFQERGVYCMKDLGQFASKQRLEECGGLSTHTHVAFVREARGEGRA